MARLPAGTILGQNVRRLRETNGWHAAVLAARLGWTSQQLEALENGALDLDIDSLDQLSTALGTPPHALMEDLCENQVEQRQLRFA